jgi:hypothetical protein
MRGNLDFFKWRERFEDEYIEKMKEYKVQIKEWKKRKKLKVDEQVIATT